MRARVLAFLVALICLIAPALADERPPSIEYGGTRESSRWIELPGHGGVAVDRGVAWKGVKVYLSFTWELVAVDAATEKPLWWRSVSAFWNRVGFKEIEAAGGKKVWAVELRPARDESEAADRVAYHDLTTGEPIPGPGEAARPAGTPVAPRKVLAGSKGTREAPFRGIVTTAENWKEAARRIFGEAAAAEVVGDLGPLGPGEVVLIVYDGATSNCSGIECAEAYDDGARVLVRLRHGWYQTMGGAHLEHPFGIFVLPRHDGKPYVLERNVQGYIGGPAIWKEDSRLTIAEEMAPEHPAGR